MMNTNLNINMNMYVNMNMNKIIKDFYIGVDCAPPTSQSEDLFLKFFHFFTLKKHLICNILFFYTGWLTFQ